MDQLTTELLDEIFSHIDSPKELLNLAYICRRFASLITPRHIEYRELSADLSTTEVWAHLARRPDLTKNIRSIHGPQPPRLGTTNGGQPITLMDEHDCRARRQRKEETIKNMTLSLRSMPRLKAFLCTLPASPSILHELSRMVTLEQLNGFIVKPGRQHPDIQHLVLVLNTLFDSNIYSIHPQNWNLPKLINLQVKPYPNKDTPNVHMSQLLRQSGVSLQVPLIILRNL